MVCQDIEVAYFDASGVSDLEFVISCFPPGDIPGGVMVDVNYHGCEVAHLQPGGELVTDRKGLVTGQLVFLVPVGNWGLVPCVDSAHIHSGFCHMEKRKVCFTPGWWTVTCDYTLRPTTRSRAPRRSPLCSHPSG